MTTKLNFLPVPAPRAAPRAAAPIGSAVARLLNATQTAASTMANALRAVRPAAIQAELRQTATDIEAERPEMALTLRSVAAKGWIY